MGDALLAEEVAVEVCALLARLAPWIIGNILHFGVHCINVSLGHPALWTLRDFEIAEIRALGKAPTVSELVQGRHSFVDVVLHWLHDLRFVSGIRRGNMATWKGPGVDR